MTDSSRPGRGPGPAPAVGDAVHDSARDRVGVVMGRVGPCFQLRPLGGGREWDARPDRIRALSSTELLSARVATANARSRGSLGLSEPPEMQRTDQTDDGAQ